MENKDVKQSFKLTMMRGAFSVFEKRIIYKIVEFAQPYFSEVNLHEGGRVVQMEQDLVNVEFDIKEFSNITNSGNLYEDLKRALLHLSSRPVAIQDTENVWQPIYILGFPKYEKYTGKVKFKVQSEFWNACKDLTTGYSTYELKTAAKMRSVYSMRMYELVSEQRQLARTGEGLVFTIEQLKNMFGISAEKYPLTANFLQRIIKPAQKELDEGAPWTFTYEPIKNGTRKIQGIKICPRENRLFRDVDLESARLAKMISKSAIMPSNIYKYVQTKLELTDKEMQNNANTFYNAYRKIEDFENVFAAIVARARANGKGTGWIINALKGEITNANNK